MLGPTEQRHHHSSIDTLGQEHGGSGVPGVVQSQRRDVCSLGEGAPRLGVDRAVLGLPVRAGEHQVVFMPSRPDGEPVTAWSRRCSRSCCISCGGTASVRRPARDLTSSKIQPPPVRWGHLDGWWSGSGSPQPWCQPGRWSWRRTRS